MTSELMFWRAMAGYAVARAQAQRARAKAGQTELGASALEWAIISAILVAAALAIGVVVKRVITKRTAEIDQDGDPGFRPGLVDGTHDRLDIGAEPAMAVSAAPCKRHFVAHHLPHHVGRALGDQRRMRDDDDTDIAHVLSPTVFATVRTSSAVERAPASI